MKLLTRLRRAGLRGLGIVSPSEAFISDWASDVATGPLPSARNESACHPRSGCDCGADVVRASGGSGRVAMCGAAGCVPAMTRDEAARGRQSGGEGPC